ncbi:MAG: hypothetical protein E6932_29870, partial [Citrobacter freundii]|nr:hypothetical protein [Citrobacter freundii]
TSEIVAIYHRSPLFLNHKNNIALSKNMSSIFGIDFKNFLYAILCRCLSFSSASRRSVSQATTITL